MFPEPINSDLSSFVAAVAAKKQSGQALTAANAAQAAAQQTDTADGQAVTTTQAQLIADIQAYAQGQTPPLPPVGPSFHARTSGTVPVWQTLLAQFLQLIAQYLQTNPLGGSGGAMSPHQINWGGLLQQLLPILLQILNQVK